MTEDEGGGMVTRPCLQPLKPPHTPCAFINHLPDSISAFLGASGVDTMCWYFLKKMFPEHCTKACTEEFWILSFSQSCSSGSRSFTLRRFVRAWSHPDFPENTLPTSWRVNRSWVLGRKNYWPLKVFKVLSKRRDLIVQWCSFISYKNGLRPRVPNYVRVAFRWTSFNQRFS